MQPSLIKILALALLPVALFTKNTPVSIYSFKVSNINQHDSIDFNDFRGKKILIVNTATSSEYSPQIASLDSLYMQNKDSLVVIAFPGNSFGNESEKNRDIRKLMKQRFHFHFLMAEKTKVKGDKISPLYQWLTTREQNGAFNSKVKNDFYKYLISKSGNLIGVFNETISPTGPEIRRALNNQPLN